jgi:hypothetical protein
MGRPDPIKPLHSPNNLYPKAIDLGSLVVFLLFPLPRMISKGARLRPAFQDKALCGQAKADASLISQHSLVPTAHPSTRSNRSNTNRRSSGLSSPSLCQLRQVWPRQLEGAWTRVSANAPPWGWVQLPLVSRAVGWGLPVGGGT